MLRPARWLGLSFGLLALVFLAGGCGTSSTKPMRVRGTIKWSDGTPVSGAVVIFAATAKEGGRDANGFTADDGTFDLTTYNFGDGAMAGEYKILVTQPDMVKGDETVQGASPAEMMQKWVAAKKKAASAPPPSRDAIPTVYAKVETTPLRWTVSSGNTSPELKIQKRK
jgi:hypothetical protein